ncbi:MAG: type III pantothenate kinase [Sphingorhabdus sp.]|jgi:type III pantothenate kinase|uniref:type III pantothenate kinase n=1 Tax=Sphingorhabdus sp. TaxID=1902408 RepID=UPI00273F0A46|nr:type III pantothenate kinase [Sphingorhabdus sp.]MDP4872593.1 type III pantothenate kinase [Sphingorhabdus sp.]
MLLAIDTGNTNAKFALVDDTGKILQRWRIATDARRTADEYAVWLDQLIQMAGYRRSDIDAVIIATVVPRALHNLQLLASRYFSCEALVAGRGAVGWGIQLRVAEPHAVGADRAVNAIAAQSLTEGHKIVISFGTATTFDYIGPDGSYRGGSIAPGVNLSLDALYAAAAMLPRIAIEPPPNESVIGTTTVGQMQIGIYWGYVAMIEGMIARMKAEIGEPVSVIATGGLAILFQQHGHLFDRVEPDLTLRGLALLYRNRKLT